MNMIDIITKKKRGTELSSNEIRWLISGVTDGSIPDYQISAWLMAVIFKGMSDPERVELTLSMAESGDMMDLSALPGIKGDKHSTGGVGDKTTLIVAPLAAACGLTMAKMSGRGLGFTGGTVDKLEAIPGFRTELSPDEFLACVNKTGLCVVGQTGKLAPADKKLYALRDVTATIDSIPLIASSIMSKKLAAGADCILLDVKTGSGAFMKTLDSSRELARAMVDIGNGAGRQCAALITDMDIPLGNAIGNALEVREAIDVLKGGGPEDLVEVSVALAAALLRLASRLEPDKFPNSEEESLALVHEKLANRDALKLFGAMVASQGGNDGIIEDVSLLPHAEVILELRADSCGYITEMNSEAVGTACVMLGAGRLTKDDKIDHSAGIVLRKKAGDWVEAGEVIAEIHAKNEEQAVNGINMLREITKTAKTPPEPRRLIYGLVE